MFKLDTIELEMHIIEELSPIKDLLNLKEIHFVQNNLGSEEGTYIFSDRQGYHLVYTEKGCETKHNVTDNLFEITFWVANTLVSSLALELLKKNISKVGNQRQYIWEQKLIHLEKMGPNYKKAAEIQVDENLKNNPL